MKSGPLLPVPAADPHVMLFGGRFYLYATDAGKTEPGFACWSSSNLSDWTPHGMALRLRDVSWAIKDDWAPAVIERDGIFFMYFSADSRIGVATSASPTGPFSDAIGEPLCPYKDDISVIDPYPFIDDDGRAYLYWGAIPAFWMDAQRVTIVESLSVRELDHNMCRFVGPEIPTIHSPIGSQKFPELDHIEASCVFKRKGRYYLMWSRGNHGMRDLERTYRVEYAWSTSPIGPWTLPPTSTVLQSDERIEAFGPGHHSVVQIPETDRRLCFYHRHRGDGLRYVYVSELALDEHGLIKPIQVR